MFEKYSNIYRKVISLSLLKEFLQSSCCDIMEIHNKKNKKKIAVAS